MLQLEMDRISGEDRRTHARLLAHARLAQQIAQQVQALTARRDTLVGACTIWAEDLAAKYGLRPQLGDTVDDRGFITRSPDSLMADETVKSESTPD